MADREIPTRLEHLVDGELGRAVLNGFFLVAYEATTEIVDRAGGAEVFKVVFERALASAGQLAVPDDVPAEARDEWRKAAVEAVYYFRDYMPDFET